MHACLLLPLSLPRSPAPGRCFQAREMRARHAILHVLRAAPRVILAADEAARLRQALLRPLTPQTNVQLPLNSANALV
eukprot:6207662-Pleurochrysis_carterae.AAC.2